MKEKMKDIFMKEKRVYFNEYCNYVVLVLKTIRKDVETSQRLEKQARERRFL